MITTRLPALACTVAVATLLGCAQPTALLQTGKVTALTGQAAQQRAENLATARGGPGQGKRDAKLETVALFEGKAMLTGVTVSRQGRIFLCYPRWGDRVNHTVVELKGNELVPFPDA